MGVCRHPNCEVHGKSPCVGIGCDGRDRIGDREAAMKYIVVVTGVGSFEFATYDDAREAVKMIGYVQVYHPGLALDAWNTIVPDDDELDGSAGEGCGDGMFSDSQTLPEPADWDN